MNALDFDALISLSAPDAVASVGPSGSREGRTAIGQLCEDFTGSLADFGSRFDEVRDLRSSVAFVVFTHRGHPPGGTSWAQILSGVALALMDGLILRQMNSTDAAEARAAAERLSRAWG